MIDPSLSLISNKTLFNNYLTVGSLFSGVGGIDLAFQQAGFKISWSNEIDKDACTTMRQNFNHDIYHCDIKKLNLTQRVDVIVAGFPCQVFSVAGYRNGLSDKREAIFFDMMKIIKKLKPKVILLENVKNLTTHRQGQTMKIILKEIKKAGYAVKYNVLNTCKYSNIPQNRERVYIVGFQDIELLNKFEFPQKIKNTLSIQDFLEKNVEDSFYYKNTKYNNEFEKIITNKNTCYQWGRQHVRENKSNMCPTLTANMGTGGHNVPLILDDKGIRKLTPRECFRFQGFPENFKLPQIARLKLYKQAGNSVSVPVINRIAKTIYNIF